MDGLKRAIKYQKLDRMKSIGVFWAVMLILNIASYIFNYKYNTGFSFGLYDITAEGAPVVSIVGANIIPVFIFYIVYCYEMYYEYFPIAIGFSITRKDFYKSALVDNIIVAFAFAAIQSVLMKLEVKLISAVSVSPKLDYGIFNITTDSIIFIIISLFIVSLTIISILNLIAALNYRYGAKFWIAVGIIFSLCTFFIGASVTGPLDMLLTTRLNYLHILIITATISIAYLIGLVIIKYTNVKNKII